MARPKKSAEVPAPKDPRAVKRGCVSCVHYPLDKGAFPCKDCEGWNYWEDNDPAKPAQS